MQQLSLGNITVDVTQKNVKNIHLSVYPPTGRVTITAPTRFDIDTIRIYAISKLSWIKRQQVKFTGQRRESSRDFITQESHYFKGKRYLLKVKELDSVPQIILKHNTIELTVRPNTSKEKKGELLDNWYRGKLKEHIPVLIQKWEKVMKLQVNEIAIKKMKTKWGTCNIEAKRIWLNLELMKKPPECIEYILVHELVHLFEKNHNDRFVAYMDKFLPQWRHLKDELNRLPVSHRDWDY